MVRGTYEAFTSLDVWANIHVYGKQPFVLNVTVLFQICLLPGSSQHPRTRALTGIRLLLFWVLGCPLEWPTDDEHDDETDAHFNAMGERFAPPRRRSVLPCLQMRHLPEPSEWVRWRFERLGNTFYKLSFSGSSLVNQRWIWRSHVSGTHSHQGRLKTSMMIELIRKYCEGYSSSTGLTISFCCKAKFTGIDIQFFSYSIQYVHKGFFRMVVLKCLASALWTG